MLDATSNHFQITKLLQYHSILTAWSHRPEDLSELISQKGPCYMGDVRIMVLRPVDFNAMRWMLVLCKAL